MESSLFFRAKDSMLNTQFLTHQVKIKETNKTKQNTAELSSSYVLAENEITIETNTLD